MRKSMDIIHGIHETVFHGVLVESSIFQTVLMDSMETIEN